MGTSSNRFFRASPAPIRGESPYLMARAQTMPVYHGEEAASQAANALMRAYSMGQQRMAGPPRDAALTAPPPHPGSHKAQ